MGNSTSSTSYKTPSGGRVDDTLMTRNSPVFFATAIGLIVKVELFVDNETGLYYVRFELAQARNATLLERFFSWARVDIRLRGQTSTFPVTLQAATPNALDLVHDPKAVIYARPTQDQMVSRQTFQLKLPPEVLDLLKQGNLMQTLICSAPGESGVAKERLQKEFELGTSPPDLLAKS